MLTVRPTIQGTGLGRQLLEAAERWAIEQWSSRSMHMTVSCNAPSSSPGTNDEGTVGPGTQAFSVRR